MKPAKQHRRNGLLALTPIFAMGVLLVCLSVYYRGLSDAPMLLIFILTSVVAVMTTLGVPLRDRIRTFSAGAGSTDLLLMVWVFMLAGAFASSARQMGAVDATVNLTLRMLPANFALAGLFLSACIVSLCMGTSVGTIVALMPVAAGLAERTALALPLMAAAVVGGAFFGDNLSFISDTTIVSTQSQGCKMSDKFRFNLRLALPVAVVVTIIYVLMGQVAVEPTVYLPALWWKTLPYLAVILLAASGVHVLVVLLMGNLLTGMVGICDGTFCLKSWIAAMLAGIEGMSELILISMLAGGIFALIRYNGGMTYIIRMLTRRVHSRHGAELSICSLVAIANIITANNTVAILSVGNIAQYISSRYGIDARRSASLLDTTSCVVQGMLPYGAQLLMASGLAGISALRIMPYLFYPMLLAVAISLTILIGKPKKHATACL